MAASSPGIGRNREQGRTFLGESCTQKALTPLAEGFPMLPLGQALGLGQQALEAALVKGHRDGPV